MHTAQQRIKPGIQRDRYQQTRHRADQRQPPRQPRIAIAAGGEHQHTDKNR